MLERFAELEDAIRSASALSDKELPTIAPQEWRMIQQLCQALKPFMDITKVISGENYTTASLVIVMACGLTDTYSEHAKEQFCGAVRNVVSFLLRGIEERFQNIKFSLTLALCTMLDARFKKKIAFASEAPAENVKKVLINQVSQMVNEYIATTNSTSSYSTIQHVDDTETCSVI
ncbi:hypothetical protein PR048_001362 [Dryococelus australis]|uniref:Uncharacterized protein n=1 Tax=Dryococelus australis TaxID=614101 RepID=A0ABQ9IH89_9NEOP|nr:hypothetical protein PR048_001362 [Dryococelus australis]